MDYNNFIQKFRKNPDYQAEQEVRQQKILAETQKQAEVEESHPQPFTILWLDDECKDVTEVFFAMNKKDAKKYVRKNYSHVPTFGVFYGESTADEDLAFNEESMGHK